MSEKVENSTVRHSLLVAIFIFDAITPQLRADVILPSRLRPGSQYEIAFVTSDKTTATSSNIADYNNFVTAEANQDPILSSFGATWKAIASTESVAANVNAPNDGSIPVYNTDGQLIADSDVPLYSGGRILNFGPIYTQNGSYISTTGSYWVWTGTSSFGATCAGSALGDDSPVVGSPYIGGPPSWWLDTSTVSAYPYYPPSTNAYPVYALSSPITVSIPEPSTFVLLGIGAISLLAYAWRRRGTA